MAGETRVPNGIGTCAISEGLFGMHDMDSESIEEAWVGSKGSTCCCTAATAAAAVADAVPAVVVAEEEEEEVGVVVVVVVVVNSEDAEAIGDAADIDVDVDVDCWVG